MMSVFWVVVIGAIVWAVASLTSGGRRGNDEIAERPEEILDRRLASGEIDQATYDALRGKLRDARIARA